MNKRFVDQNNSLFYEYCPLYQNNKCERMNYLKTCFAFEFLDQEALNATYGYAFFFIIRSKLTYLIHNHTKDSQAHAVWLLTFQSHTKSTK